MTARPLRLADIPALSSLATPAVGQYFSDRIDTLSAMQSYVEAALADHTTQAFAIESGDAVVGSSRLFRIDNSNRNAEIGHTFYSEQVWRTHVNTATKLLLLGYAFDTLKFLRVSFRTDLRNVRSQAAIARLGAVHEGVNRNDRIVWDGYVRSSVTYSILTEEWLAVKVRLETRVAMDF
ncbi:MAG: GNAT family N-acetyltransferase [Fimbriimonadaceae bacterium]